MKELNELFNSVSENLLNEINTSFPAEIVIYDSSNQLATIKPTLKRKLKDGSSFEMPEIYNVPVVFSRSKDFFIHFPLKKGDRVLVVVAQRSLDKWLNDGAKQTPDDNRKFNLSDAIALPGLYPKIEPLIFKSDKDAISINSKNGFIQISENGDIKLKNNKAEINASNDGKFKITNGSIDLLTEISTLLQNLIQAKVITAIGDMPFTPNTVANLTTNKTNIDKIKG